MQSFRDAATLLVLVLLLLTVRVETTGSESTPVVPDAAEPEIALADPTAHRFEPFVLSAERPLDGRQVRQVRAVADRIDVDHREDPDRQVLLKVGGATWVLSFETDASEAAADSEPARPGLEPRPAPAKPCASEFARLSS